MRPTLPILGRLGFWLRTRPFLAVLLLLLFAGGVAMVVAWDRIDRLGDDLERSRARSFIQRGMKAWQDGDAATARLCFETAISIDADNLDAALTLGRLHLQQGSRAKGRATFVETAKRFPIQVSGRIALVYHDSLIGCGWWEELAALGFEQLAGLGRPEPLWLNAAIEGTRLRGWTKSELAARLEKMPLDPVSRQLVLAQGALNGGEPAAARELLGQAKATLKLESAWIVARIWRRAGDTAEARLALARTDAPIGTEMRLLTDYWIMQDEPELQEKQFARIVTRAFTPPTAPMLIPNLVNLTLAQGKGGNSAMLLNELGRRRANLVVQNISALWLLALREGDRTSAASWLGSLREAIDNPPVIKSLQPWNEKTFILITGSLPLSRETLYALIYTLEPARGEPAETKP